MIKLDLYSIKGTKKGQISLPKELEIEVNKKLIAQAVRVYQDRIHLGLSKVKTRGEVAISTRKIYRQKGTGGARHGSKGAPIFVGGGVAHGPKGIKRILELPQEMRKQALASAITSKAKNSLVVAVDDINSLGKTKEAQSFINKIVSEEKSFAKEKIFTFVLAKENRSKGMFIRNIKKASQIHFEDLNAYNVFFSGVLILDSKAIQVEEKKVAKKPAAKKVQTKKVIK